MIFNARSIVLATVIALCAAPGMNAQVKDVLKDILKSVLNGPFKGIQLSLPASYPPSDGGGECDVATEKCRVWVALTIPKAEHVGQGVYAPRCATDKDKIREHLLRQVLTRAADLPLIGVEKVGSGTVVTGPDFYSSMIFIGVTMLLQAAQPDTPLGQALFPPRNLSFCYPLTVKLPRDARNIQIDYWVDEIGQRPLIRQKMGDGRTYVYADPDVTKWPWLKTVPNEDVAHALFDGNAERQPLVLDGMPAGALVTAVFKHWAGGYVRRAGLVVRFEMPPSVQRVPMRAPNAQQPS